MEWKDGWPIILEQGKAVPTVVNKSDLTKCQTLCEVTGNFTFTDRFDEEQLDYSWIYLRNPKMTNYDWTTVVGIALKADTANIYGTDSPTAIFYRQKNQSFSAETEVNFTPQSDQQLAGLTLFMNERNSFVFGKTIIDGHPALILIRTEAGQHTTIATAPLHTDSPIRLKVEGNARYYSFYYAIGQGDWQTLAQGCDGLQLTTKVAGGFVGTTIGLYATAKLE